MADEHRERRGPADLSELCFRITQHPNPDVRAVGGVLYGKTVGAGRHWWRASLAQIQDLSHLSRGRTRTALDILVRQEAWFCRRPVRGRVEPGEGGDEYAPALVKRRIHAVRRDRETEDELLAAALFRELEEAARGAGTRKWPGELGDSPGH
jgi:hypothetical protein